MSQLSTVYKLIFFTNVLRVLEERKMNKSDLSEQSGVSPSYLSDLTTGNANPSLEIMESIASALGVPLPTLLENTDLTPDELKELTGDPQGVPSSVPNGFERICATLPGHRAFLVKKWQAEAAAMLKRLDAKEKESTEK